MFRDSITSTALTGDVPDMSLGHISCAGFRNDVSFLASARAFLVHRMHEGEKLSIAFETRNGTWSPVLCVPDTLLIVNIGGLKEQANKAFEDIDKTFLSEYAGFEEVPKIRAFYERSFAARCFVNKAAKMSVVFVDHIDMRTLHFLECSILIMLPWYHEREPKLTDDETALVKCLMNKASTSSDYVKCIEKIAAQFDFRTTAIKAMLKGFTVKHHQAQLTNLRNHMDSLYSRLEDLLSEIGSLNKQREDDEIRIMGLEAAIAKGEGDEELMNFILAHENINIVRMLDRGFQITVRTQYVPTTDTIKEARVALRENKGWLERRGSSAISEEDMKSLFKAIFVDRIIKLNFCASYNVTLSTDAYRIPVGGYEFGPEFDDCMPNPHINIHRCGGDYIRDWSDEVLHGDLIGVLCTCVASANSLNFGDGIVMSAFMDSMYGCGGRKCKALVLPDDRNVTPEEAIAWIKEQKGE